MSDIKIFRISGNEAEELPCHFVAMEKDLQSLLEKNMEKCLGIKFLAHEHGTGRTHRGFIDSLGIDENNCPIIVEYKRRNNDNIINQGLFYLDWLLDHQSEFILLVEKTLGHEIAEAIDFSDTRILCVASDFSRFDERAICQIGRNVELIRYKFFADDLLMIELLNSSVAPFFGTEEREEQSSGDVGMSPNLRLRMRNMSSETEKLYLDLLSFAQNLGEDVTIRFLKHYVALSRMRNFTSIQPQKNILKIWLNFEPSEFAEEGFSRDVREIGHHASGNLEIDLHNEADLSKAKPLIDEAYQRN